MKRAIKVILVTATILLFLFGLHPVATQYTQEPEPETKQNFPVGEDAKIELKPISCELGCVGGNNVPREQEILPSEPVLTYDNKEDATLLAKAAYGEYRGSNDEEVLAVYWCIFNRVDAEGYGMGNDIEYVLTFPYQFLGYSPDNPVDDRLIDLAYEAMTAWKTEKLTGELSAERVIPPEYLWFSGNTECTHNIYRNTFEFTKSTDYITWGDSGN